MDDALGHEITQLLQAWRLGDEGALDKLTPQVYRELHLARQALHGAGTRRPYATDDGSDQ